MSEPTTFHTDKLPLEYLNSLLQRYTRLDPRLMAGPGVGEGVEKALLWTGTADTQAASAIAAPLTAFLDTWKARSGATFRAPI